jgi:hypothetical protein
MFECYRAEFRNSPLSLLTDWRESVPMVIDAAEPITRADHDGAVGIRAR